MWQSGVGGSFDSDGMGTLVKNQTPAVCFTQNTRDEVRFVGGDGQIVGALAAETGTKQQPYLAIGLDSELNAVENGSGPLKAISPTGGGVPAMVATGFQSSQSGIREVEAHATLDSNNGSRRNNGVIQGTAVRKLTPRECERLQGFPDDYTKISEKTAYGPRYKALGNSMAVPVMRWIGERIELVEGMLQKDDWLTELEESLSD